jgi:hypothetical protein
VKLYDVLVASFIVDSVDHVVLMLPCDLLAGAVMARPFSASSSANDEQSDTHHYLKTAKQTGVRLDRRRYYKYILVV